MDLSFATLAASVVVSSIGFGLFVYGKKEARAPQLLAGLVMMGCPYFIPSALGIWGIGVASMLGMDFALRRDM